MNPFKLARASVRAVYGLLTLVGDLRLWVDYFRWQEGVLAQMADDAEEHIAEQAKHYFGEEAA